MYQRKMSELLPESWSGLAKIPSDGHWNMDENKERWLKWHKANPQVWELFKQFSFEVIESGRKKYSAWQVIGRCRWETDIQTTGKEFKISNDFIAYYARLFMETYPEHKGFFQIKKLKSEKQD